jgi:hypothetical protein
VVLLLLEVCGHWKALTFEANLSTVQIDEANRTRVGRGAALTNVESRP